MSRLGRRGFIGGVAGALVGGASGREREFLIDIHQHVNYSGRLNDAMFRHQEAMGIGRTVLLPAGTAVDRDSTHRGKSNGLAARIFGTRAAARVAEERPGEYVFFCNEVPDLAGSIAEMEKWLKRGACGIGEMKYALACDGPEMRRVYDLAKEYEVPVLLHFQYGMYNEGFERFYKILEAYPTVNFIGHAQTWWGHVDANHEREALYPGWKVTPGGLTERYLSDYPNMYGDLSAGSGLNAMWRDEEFGERFFHRHQDKLCLGTDCSDSAGEGTACSGAQMIATVRRWVPEDSVRAKIMSGNAKRIIRM